MKIDLTNCGGLRIVPAGGGAQVTYGRNVFSRTVTVGSKTGVVRAPSPGVLSPGFRDTSKPLLVVDGPVYIPRIAILTGTHPDVFGFGGYLGTKTLVWRFTDGLSYQDVSFDVLSVIPAAFSGGLVVENLNITDATLPIERKIGGELWSRVNSSIIARSDGRNVYFVNAGNEPGWTWSGFGSWTGYDIVLDGLEKL